MIAPPRWPDGLGPGELRAAALAYAEAGWRIFPVFPRAKRPLGQFAPNGFKDASADPERVRY